MDIFKAWNREWYKLSKFKISAIGIDVTKKVFIQDTGQKAAVNYILAESLENGGSSFCSAVHEKRKHGFAIQWTSMKEAVLFHSLSFPGYKYEQKNCSVDGERKNHWNISEELVSRKTKNLHAHCICYAFPNASIFSETGRRELNCWMSYICGGLCFLFSKKNDH